MALLGSLVDNFRSASLDTAKWNAVNAAAAYGFQAGGRYTFIVEAGGTGDTSLVSDAAYNLTGSHLHMHLIEAGEQEAGLETYPIILTENPANTNDALLIVVSNGLVGLYEFVGGVGTLLATPAYNSTTMQWFRIREAGGTVFFESAPAAQGPWTSLASVAPTVDITALYARARVFCFASLATAKQAAITDVNYLQPPDLEFPNGELPIGAEAAFGADIDGDQSAWVWTDLSSPEMMAQTITPTRGRQDESSDVSPTQAAATLDNPDGDLTPDNPSSIYYPNVDLGTPFRLWLDVSTPRLWLRDEEGSRARVEHQTQFDVTGDIDVRIDMQLGPKDPGASSTIVAGVYDYAADERAWRLVILDGGFAQFTWSEDGTLATTTDVTSTVPVFPTNARAVLRVTLDVNNGAGGNDVKFYLGESMSGPWMQVGPTTTNSGTTSIFAANTSLDVGNEVGQSGTFSPRATVYDFELRDGIGGTLVADANFTEQTSGVPAFVDPTGLLWQIEGSARLDNQWYRIVGTVDSWEPNWPWGDLSAQAPGGLTEGQARVDIEVAGILRRLGQGASPLDSPLRRAISDEPTLQAYWPMEDLKDSTQIASGLPNGSAMTVTGAVDFANNDDLLGSKPLPALTATSGLYGAVTGVFTGQWQIDWYLYIPAQPASQAFFLNATGDGTVVTWLVDTSAGNVGVRGLNALGGTVTSGASSATSFFGQWIHVRLFAQQNGANVDWTFVWFPVTYPATGGFFFSGSYAGSVGGITSVGVPVDADNAGIAMGQLAVMDAANLDTADNAATGWMGDTAVERMARLCREEGVSFRVFGRSSESARMGSQQIATLLDLLDDAADADGGVLYEMPDAVGLIYRTRASFYNQPANMTLDALENELQNPFAPVLDDQRVRNDVTVTRRGGSSVQVVDQASIDKRGTYDESVTLNLLADSQLADAAGWRLHQGTVPGMRYAQLTTSLGAAPQVIDEWLTVDQGAKVVVTNLPPQHPNADVAVIVEGYQEPFSPTTWDPQMNCSPASVWDVVELDGDWVDDTYLLRLETDGSELQFAVDDNDTSLFVVVTAGPYWVTDAGEFPFDIRVGGERMTVTAIGAATGGEEFTGAGDFEDSTATTAFVAPSVVAPASGDLLICAWSSYQFLDTYTLPGGMTIAALTDGTYTSFEDATQVLGASGATGTRTATFGTADTWAAMSVVAHSALGTPTVAEFLNSVTTGPATDITITTILEASVGDWLLALQGWDWDPGDNMGAPSGDGWVAVADSFNASADTSRVRAWAKQVTVAGIQSVTFPVVGGINDNHARLYVLENVTGITQQFTVTRSVNGVVKSHAAGAPVELWYQPVLAR